MVKLNLFEYIENIPTKEICQNYIDKYSEVGIFSIIPEFSKIDFNTKYLSPFRKDNNKGCFFKLLDFEFSIYFVDFAFYKTHINCFEAIKLYFNCNIFEAFKIIDDYYSNKPIPKKQIVYKNKEGKNIIIQTYCRKFNKKDLIFWKQYGLDFKDIKNYVKPISLFIVNKEIYSADDYSYEIRNYYSKDLVKIYQPFNKKFKWLTNSKKTDIGNYHKIDLCGNYVIITKSFKDCFILKKFVGNNVIWLNSETVKLNTEMLNDLYVRFKKIIIFFDYDKTGIQYSYKLKKEFNKNINIEVFFTKSINCKDISDCYKNNKKLFYNLILKLKKLAYENN